MSHGFLASTGPAIWQTCGCQTHHLHPVASLDIALPFRRFALSRGKGESGGMWNEYLRRSRLHTGAMAPSWLYSLDKTNRQLFAQDLRGREELFLRYDAAAVICIDIDHNF